MPTDRLEFYVVFQKPLDDPEGYVLRRQTVRPGGAIEIAPEAICGPTLEDIRLAVPKYCVRLERFPDDDPAILEVWL